MQLVQDEQEMFVTVNYFSEFMGQLSVIIDRVDTSPSSIYMALQKRIKKKAVTKTVQFLALKELQLQQAYIKKHFRRQLLGY